MLEKEFQYYLDNQKELIVKYNGRFLVIKDEKVIADYADSTVAYFEAQKENKLGTFIIQYCSAGNMAYTHTFSSFNVTF